MKTLVFALVAGTVFLVAVLALADVGSGIAARLDTLERLIEGFDGGYCDGYEAAWFDSGEVLLNWQEVDGCTGL